MEVHSLKGPKSQEGAVFTLSEFIKIIVQNLYFSKVFVYHELIIWSDFIFFQKLSCSCLKVGSARKKLHSQCLNKVLGGCCMCSHCRSCVIVY